MPPSFENRVQAHLRANLQRLSPEQRKTLATAQEFLAAVAKFIATAEGDPAAFVTGYHRVEAAFSDVKDLARDLRRLQASAIDAVRAEDAAAEAAAKAEIEAAERAKAAKEARRARWSELRALEAEFGADA